MARNPDNRWVFNTFDQSGEPTSFSVHAAAGAMDLATIPAALTTLITAIDTELVDWTPISYNAAIGRRLSTAIVGEGNREDKLEFKYFDNVTFKPYTTEVPCRKGDLATETGSDLIPLATWETLTKPAFEALARSPDGNAVTLAAVRLIGRNV